MKLGGYFLLFFLLGLAGYLMYNDQQYEPTISIQLKPYVTEWKHAMEQAGLDWKWKFNQIDKIELSNITMHGTSSDILNVITIDRDILPDTILTRQTVYHELGHYVFGMEHVDTKSIMNINDLGSDFYRENWNRLVKEYIQQAK